MPPAPFSARSRSGNLGRIAGLEWASRYIWSDTPSPSDVPDRGDRVILPVEMTYYRGKGGTGIRLT